MFEKDLSEPYCIYTYRFFTHNHPELTRVVLSKRNEIVGCIIAKIDQRGSSRRGYIGMLTVQPQYRGRGLAVQLIKDVLLEMERQNCDEVVLETEVSNRAAIQLY